MSTLYPVQTSTPNGMVIAPSQVVATEAFDLIVDPANPASDDANPGTSALPLKTVSRALELVPAAWVGFSDAPAVVSAFITVLSATTEPAIDQDISIGRNYGPKSTPLCIRGTAVDQLSGDRTSSAVATTHIDDNTLAMVVDAFRGCEILIVDGPAAGQRRKVDSNTATQLFFNSTVAGLVIGNKFRVTRGTNVAWGGSLTLSGGRFGYKDVDFSFPAGKAYSLADSAFQACVEGFRLRGAAASMSVSLGNACFAFFGGGNSAPWDALGASNPFSAARAQCGTSLEKINSFGIGSDATLAFGYFVGDDVNWNIQAGGLATFNTPSFRRCQANLNGTLIDMSSTAIPSTWDEPFTPSASGAVITITGRGQYLLGQASGSPRVYNNSVGDGIQVNAGGLLNNAIAGAITGTCAKAGIRVAADAFFVRNTAPTIVGTADGTLVQNNTADPGNAGAISVLRSGVCDLTSAGAETRTLAVPAFEGQELLINCNVYVGDIALTVASAFNPAGNTIATFTAAGQAVKFSSRKIAGVLAWALTANLGTTLS